MQSFFDPIGYTLPVILKGKLIFQELNLTLSTLPWDRKVPITIIYKWRCFMKTTEDLHNLAVPHWFIGITSESRLTLHVFTDASSYAYSAVVYITSGRTAYRSLVITKSRIMPKALEKWSIPEKKILAMGEGMRISHCSKNNRLSGRPTPYMD